MNTGKTSRGIVMKLASAAAAAAVVGSALVGVTASSASTGNIVAQARALTTIMDQGKLMWSSQGTPTSPANIVPYGSWRGPKTAPKPAKHKVVDIIPCISSSVACEEAALGAAAAAQKLGWTTHIYSGGFNSAGYQTAFANVTPDHANAVIGIAVPTEQFHPELAYANSHHILTIALGDLTHTTGVRYDSYVDFRMPVMEAMLAYKMIAHLNGQVHALTVQDNGFSVLENSQQAFDKVLSQCSGCTSHLESWGLATVFGGGVQSAIDGWLVANPNTNVLDLPYSIGESSAAAGVAQANLNQHVYVLAKDGDAGGLAAIQAGQSYANAGTSTAWSGWAAIDQLIRGFAGKPYLNLQQQGLGVVLFNSDNTPANGNPDSITVYPNYRHYYEKAWGLIK